MLTRGHSKGLPTYRPLDFFLLRAPVWPVSASHAEKVSSKSSNGGRNDFLVKRYSDRSKVEALLASSPSLEAVVKTYLDEPLQLSKKEIQGVEDALTRYLIRMSTRPTPFAAFAGVGVGQVVADETGASIVRHPPHCVKPTARLDAEYLLGFVRQLEQSADIKCQLYFYANPVAYRNGGRLFIPFTDGYGQNEENKTSSVRITSALTKILLVSQQPTSWQQLFANLSDSAPTTPPEVITAFLDTLCQQNVLLSTLRPPLTTSDALAWVLQRLEETSYRDEGYQKLHDIKQELYIYNQKSIGQGNEALARLYKLTDYANGTKQSTIALDTSLPLKHAYLPRSVVKQVGLAAQVLLRLSTASPKNPSLTKYRQQFVERYSYREIPVMELLDEELGLGPPIGYKNPPATISRDPLRPNQYLVRDQLLLELAGEAIQRQQVEIVLDDHLISLLEVKKNWHEAAPQSLDIFAYIQAETEEEVSAGNFLAVVGPRVGTSPAGRSLSRMCHVLPSSLASELKRRAEVEQAYNPDVLFADLVYSHSRGHAANVAVRPPFYPFQVAVNTTPGVDPEKLIPLNDILVGVQGNRFYLKSSKYGKHIFLHSMHLLNFIGAPNVCRFLQEVCEDGTAQLTAFDWGHGARLPYQPRIRYGRIILSLARWIFPRQKEGVTVSQWPTVLNEWREIWNVPTHIYLTNSDNRLLLDLNDPLHTSVLYNEVHKAAKTGQPVVIEEALPGIGDSWIKDETGGAYLGEFVIPFERDDLETFGGHVNLNLPSPTIRNPDDTISPSDKRISDPYSFADRIKPLGSDWLYFKLYAGRSRHDDILLALQSILSDVQNDINNWFFIRYKDPLPHLRLRLQGEPDCLLQGVLPKISAKLRVLLEEGLLHTFTVDTYDREIERYGGIEAISIAETFFRIDSQLVLDLTTLRHQRSIDSSPEYLCVVTTDYLLRALGMDVQARAGHYTRCRQNHHHFSKADEATLAEEFRSCRSELWDLFQLHDEHLNHMVTLYKNKLVEAVCPLLRKLEREEKLSGHLEHVIENYRHMHCNRLALHGADEFKVTYFLDRLYDGFRHYVPDGVDL